MNEVQATVEQIKCDHIRHWKAGGMASITNKDTVYLAQVLFCDYCGGSKIQLHTIGPAPTQQPTIAKP